MSNHKFKVGDRVRVKMPTYGASGGYRKGELGAVVEIDGFIYKLDDNVWYIEEALSLVDDHVMETFHELDPNGKDAHEPGSKLDAGKNRLGLVLGGFSKALQEVGKVGTFGANKYTDNGWLSVPNGEERYTDAMLRHYFKEVSGEEKDEDSNILHAAHLAWNALARLELMIRNSDEIQWSEEDEKRVAAIMQNGNTGEHYGSMARDVFLQGVIKPYEDDFQE